MFKIDEHPSVVGYLDGINGNDFQHNNIVYFTNSKHLLPNPRGIWVDADNLVQCSIYFSVRKCVESTWLNDRDQFLVPGDGWKEDRTFCSDCLCFALFSNNIQSQHGPNHWIPFTEGEVGARDRFASHFMTDFMAGRSARRADPTGDGARTRDGRAGCPQPAAIATQREISLNGDCGALGDRALPAVQPLSFSPAAQAVLAAGRELWRYYHAQPDANPNASYYDIRAHFQGRKPNGTMNATSADEKYNELLDALKSAMKVLARQIEPKVYEYGFLRK